MTEEKRMTVAKRDELMAHISQDLAILRKLPAGDWTKDAEDQLLIGKNFVMSGVLSLEMTTGKNLRGVKGKKGSAPKSTPKPAAEANEEDLF